MRSPARFSLVAAATCLLSGIGAVGAQEDAPSAAPASTADDAAAGAFLPAGMTPRRIDERALASFSVGWDGATSSAMIEASAEARLAGSLSLRAGASADGDPSRTGPRFELRWDAAAQKSAGIDVAVSGAYDGNGFNTVPAVGLELALGRRFGATYVLANAGYGQGLELGERYGEARMAALCRVFEAASIGVDSRLQVDLERDDDEPAGERDFEWRSGLLASYTLSSYVVTLGGGVSVSRWRADERTAVGPVVMAGLGATF
jgi:hypothetical protein